MQAPAHSHHAHHPEEDHPHGLAHDLQALAEQQQRAAKRRGRRKLLGLLGAAALAPAARAANVCAIVPTETNGPYPGDGSNTLGGSIANALALSGIVRSDIRTSFAGASGTAAGVPLTVEHDARQHQRVLRRPGRLRHLRLALRPRRPLLACIPAASPTRTTCAACRQTDADGTVTFTTIFPGCYSGRMPHIHFEVYRSLTTATRGPTSSRPRSSRFPMATLQHGLRRQRLQRQRDQPAQISFATDSVFSDGYSTQLATITGSDAAGYTARIQVAINAQATTPTATPFNASMAASGSNTSLSLTGNLTVATADVGTSGAIYVALLAGGTLYFHNGSTWLAANGANGFPAYYTGTLAATHTASVLSATNISSICGLPIFMGYGASAADMVSKGQYKLVYTLCQ